MGAADNETWCTGFNNDNYRMGRNRPIRDQPGLVNYYEFGAAHPEIWQVTFCDGSARSLNYSIDPLLYGLIMNREDEQVFSEEDL